LQKADNLSSIKKRGTKTVSASEVPPSTLATNKFSPRHSVSDSLIILVANLNFGGFQMQE